MNSPCVWDSHPHLQLASENIFLSQFSYSRVSFRKQVIECKKWRHPFLTIGPRRHRHRHQQLKRPAVYHHTSITQQPRWGTYCNMEQSVTVKGQFLSNDFPFPQTFFMNQSVWVRPRDVLILLWNSIYHDSRSHLLSFFVWKLNLWTFWWHLNRYFFLLKNNQPFFVPSGKQSFSTKIIIR